MSPNGLRLVVTCALLVSVAGLPSWPRAATDAAEESVDLTLRRGGDVTLSNSAGMKLVRVKAGRFKMGAAEDERDASAAEKPRHEVTITNDYFIAVTEVTQKQYRAVMGNNPSHFRKDGEGKDDVNGIDTDDFPVEMISWHDAVAFCEKLNARPAEKKSKLRYRLPSEAEWEYACRGGHWVSDLRSRAYLPFHFKTPAATLSARQANFNARYPYAGGSKGDPLLRTCPVGSFEANALGIHDMHGNVWEWCSDWYGARYYANSPQADPRGPGEGTHRVIRGGGCERPGLYCRAAARHRSAPAGRLGALGFRVAAEMAD